jgi:LysR family transcriptional regulator, regulator for genes of the gallate degradation pathway
MIAREPKIFFPSLTQLRAFSEAARLDSISRASEELRRSQSAVTQAIQNLEVELNVSLLARTSTGSYLTDMGRILHRRAAACFSRMDIGLQDISDDDPISLARASAVARRITKSQILALIAVNEHGSFAQAARHVQVSLTSLHRSARSLEHQVGRKLFKNTAQGATTNEAGAKLSNHLLLAIRELEWAEEEIRAQKGVLRGRLLVGSLMLAGSYFISLELVHFIPKYPEVKINLVNGTYDVLLTKLRSGTMDFLLGILKNPPPIDDVTEEILGYDPYVIAVGRQHPLTSKKKVTLEDLRASEWLLPQISAHRRGAFDRLFKSGSLPRYNIETHSLPTIFVMLASGDRMALLTQSELAFEQRLGNQLVALNYKIDEPPAALGVTCRKNWEPTRLQRTFLEFLREQAKARLAQ